MRAVIITIGTELTDGRIIDTNTRYLARDLERHGARVALTLSVPDNPDEIVKALDFALGHEPGLILVSGGLGPTRDDLTSPALARALGLECKLDPLAEAMVLNAIGSTRPGPNQIKQAILPTGSIPVAPAGTAPGFIISGGEALIIVLPGVPSEMKLMWEDVSSSTPVKSILEATKAPARKTLCFYGVGEPRVGEAVESVLGESQSGLEVSICARYGEVILEISGREEDQEQIDDSMKKIGDIFAEYVYSDGKTIAEAVAGKLVHGKETLAVAESCTGGMLSETITGLSGASRFFLGGVIAYDNFVKTAILKVKQDTLDEEGAVSETVARQMAKGVRAALGAGYGIGITGIAGPEGGTPQKPVGLVYISISSNTEGEVRAFNFRGARDDVRSASVTAALHMLNRLLP
ncbi:MAG: CinA family nicotinamide mononucleotide deamidase-related protein [Thermoleophilia bacterium]